MDSVRITAFLLTCRCGSTEKGIRLVSGPMLARIQSSALATELPVWITSTNNESARFRGTQIIVAGGALSLRWFRPRMLSFVYD
jgi:hypothetical protein